MKKHLLTSVFAAALLLSVCFCSVVMAASAGEGTAAAEEKTASRTLEEFSGYLDYLYGRSYNGYLPDYAELDEAEQKPGIVAGYDLSDLPTTNMGSYIYDYDQDGQEELLVVGISGEYYLQLSMYEVTDEKKVYASDTCTVLNHIGEYPHEQFALEQGAGGTEICLYDFNGPALIALCSGSGMLATGHMSHLIPVKYDGTRFVQDIEPVGYNKFAGYDDNLLESLRPQFEALGTASLSNDDVKEIYQNLNAITKYLENPRVIVKASSTIIESDYYNKYEEWRKGSKEERFKATEIYFYSKEELTD